MCSIVERVAMYACRRCGCSCRPGAANDISRAAKADWTNVNTFFLFVLPFFFFCLFVTHVSVIGEFISQAKDK